VGNRLGPIRAEHRRCSPTTIFLYEQEIVGKIVAISAATLWRVIQICIEAELPSQ